MSDTSERFARCDVGGKVFDVFQAQVTERLSSPLCCAVQLVSEKAVSLEQLVDKEALLSLQSDKGERYVHGFVQSAEEMAKSGKRFIYMITVYSKFWKLGKTSDIRIFQEVSTPDIIKQVFEASGMVALDYDLRLNGTYAPREYCVQYRETNRAFLERLMAEEGIFYFFEIKDEKHVMVLGDKHLCHKPMPDKNEVDFLEPGQLSERGEVISRFGLSSCVTSGKAVLKDYHFQTPDKLPAAEKAGKNYVEHELYDYPGLLIDDGTGGRLAEVNLQRGEFGQINARGKSNCKRLSVGHSFKMVNHPNPDLDGEYVVAEIGHTVMQPQALQELAEVGQKNSFFNMFSCVPLKQSLRTPKQPKPSVMGLQSAVVTGPAGEEIYTDEYGRIKVQFHWDREGKNDEKSSCWMRVAQPWAGSGWGSVFIPRIGQEVIVNFMDGDPDRPIVTGAVYNGNNMPPYPLPEEKTKSTLKTHSTTGGGDQNYNELRFEDKKGEEEIYLQGEKDWNIEIKNDKSQHVGNDEALNVDHDRKKVVSNNQEEEIGENKSISVGKNHTESIGENMTLTVEKDRDETVRGNVAIHVAKSHTEEIGEKMELTIGDNAEMSINKDLSIMVAKKTVINSGEEIQIVTGSASIIMKKNGDIQIKGKNLTLNGSGNLVMKAKKISQN